MKTLSFMHFISILTHILVGVKKLVGRLHVATDFYSFLVLLSYKRNTSCDELLEQTESALFT